MIFLEKNHFFSCWAHGIALDVCWISFSEKNYSGIHCNFLFITFVETKNCLPNSLHVLLNLLYSCFVMIFLVAHGIVLDVLWIFLLRKIIYDILQSIILEIFYDVFLKNIIFFPFFTCYSALCFITFNLVKLTFLMSIVISNIYCQCWSLVLY